MADVDPGETDAGTPSDRRWLLIALVVGLPIVVLTLALAQRTWYPTGDQAQAELRMLSLPDHVPLVGAAGRIADDQGRQGNHPGPLMFWTTWPLYVLLGQSSWAFEAATALVNLAWLTVAVWLVKRRAGIGACAWFGIGALVLIGGYGLDGLSQPWNPWVSLLPFTVLVLATWSAVEGDRWAPLLAVAGACYALQGHVGYLPVTIPLVGIALVAPVWRWWQTRRATAEEEAADTARRPAPARATWWVLPVLASFVLGALLWSGPLVDVATNDPSNVDKLIANFGTPDEPPIGLGRGIEAVLQSANPAGAWVWGGAKVHGSVLPGLALLAAWAGVAVAVAVRRRRPSLTRLNALLAILLVLGVVAVSRVFGQLYLYTFRWIAPLVALLVFALGWGIATLLPAPSPTAARRWSGVAVVLLVGLSAVISVRISRQDIPYDQSWRSEQRLAPAVAAELDPDQRYLVTWDDPAYLGGLGFGLILDLERRGFDAGGLPQFDAAIEPHRVRCPGDFDGVLTVVTGERNIAAHEEQPGLTKIAEVDPRADPEAWDRAYAELVAELQGDPDHADTTPESLERSLNFVLLAPGYSDRAVDLAADLVLGGVPSAVFLDTGEVTPLADTWNARADNVRTSHPCPTRS